MIQEGTYVKLTEIGTGSTCKVYFATFEGTPCVIKEFFNKITVEEIQSEISHHSLMTGIQHVHLIAYDAINYRWIAMERCQSLGVMDYLERYGAFQPKYARYMINELIEGLEQIHALNRVHRDIKPENIMFSQQFKPKLGDFGFATTIEPSRPTQRYMGTVGYMAPELFESDKPIESTLLPSTDVFSLGVTIFNLVLAVPPIGYNRPKRSPFFQLVISENWKLFWTKVSKVELPESFKMMIEGLLSPNQSKRWTLKQLKECTWLNEETASEEEFVAYLQQLKLSD